MLHAAGRLDTPWTRDALGPEGEPWPHSARSGRLLGYEGETLALQQTVTTWSYVDKSLSHHGTVAYSGKYYADERDCLERSMYILSGIRVK